MSNEKTLWEWEASFVRSIASMEQAGVLVDKSLSEREIALGARRMLAIESNVGGKPSSPKFLEATLLGELGLPIVEPTASTRKLKREEWKPSFNKKAMEEYELILEKSNRFTPEQKKLAKLVLEYRGWQKAISTYYRAFIDKSCDDGRVRPNFKIHGTKSGRLSCEKPNFQQIPKVRDESKRWNMYTKTALIPTPGSTLWELDYSNLELRLAAQYGREMELIEAFNSGVSIWDYMSDLLGGWSKEDTKTLTYSIMYGAGLNRIMNVFGVNEREAQQIINTYFRAFSGFKKASDKAKIVAADQGYITMWTGRRRHFEYKSEHRKAFNAYLQGGAAEIVKRALIRIDNEVCNEECRLVLTVHDSIVLEISGDYAIPYLDRAQEIMAEVPAQAGFDVKFTSDRHVWGQG